MDRPGALPRLVLHIENAARVNDSLCRLIRQLLALVHEREIKVSIIDPTGCTEVLWEALGGSVHVEVCRREEEVTEPLDILVVEDTPDSLLFLKDLLETAGHRVTTAATGEEAVRSCLSHRFDLVLLDLVLPDRDGMSVAEAIRGSGAPVVAMSAYLDRWSEEDYRRAGFRSRLRKPFKSAELLSALRH
ncbi:MAG TPA: response regulator [Planctomycetota bacterium]|jgi:CheY-like chemotaxis protein|nr:response regulator [Planctomycetota bacterium]